MNKTIKDSKEDDLNQLKRRIDTLERIVHRFVPTDAEGEYTDEFQTKLQESDQDIANGNLTDITSLDDIKEG